MLGSEKILTESTILVDNGIYLALRRAQGTVGTVGTVGVEELLERRVAVVRSFNRFHTRQIGLLQEGYLDGPFSLTQVRMLYELAHHELTTASELARDLGLDPGYLSRLLRGFADLGLVD